VHQLGDPAWGSRAAQAGPWSRWCRHGPWAPDGLQWSGSPPGLAVDLSRHVFGGATVEGWWKALFGKATEMEIVGKSHWMEVFSWEIHGTKWVVVQQWWWKSSQNVCLNSSKHRKDSKLQMILNQAFQLWLRVHDYLFAQPDRSGFMVSCGKFMNCSLENCSEI